MRRTKAQPIDELLGGVLRELGLESPLMEYRLVQSWPEAVRQVYGDGIGSRIAAATTDVRINNQTLHVNLTSPALRQQIRMNALPLVEALNAAAGARLITDLALH